MSCEVANPDVIAFGTRIAIYGYSACSTLLGFFTLISTGTRRKIEEEDNETEYTRIVVQHIQDVQGSVMTSTLTGIALIGASLFQQHRFNTFGLFHAYIVLMLLWVISLTGMWFVIHAWVFDIFRKQKRQMSTFSFWSRIVFQSKWFTLHLCLMGGYGIYVTLTRKNFPSPDTIPKFFNNKFWSMLIYLIAAAPILNLCMLFMSTSLVVWMLSVLVALLSKNNWRGQVEPRVFCVFWLLEYVLIITGLVITIESLVQKYTCGVKYGWSFGSTLAVSLTVIPLRLVLWRLWQLMVGPGEDQTGHARPSTELEPLSEYCYALQKCSDDDKLHQQIDNQYTVVCQVPRQPSRGELPGTDHGGQTSARWFGRLELRASAKV